MPPPAAAPHEEGASPGTPSPGDSTGEGSDDDDGGDQEAAYLCYVLRSLDSKRTRTYTGITNNLSRRILRHNGELAGGARATRSGRPWRVFAAVRGFSSKNDALCFEWRAKRQRAQSSEKLIPMCGGLDRRCANLCDVLRLERWTKKCRPAAETSLQVTWYGGAPWGLRRRTFPAHVTEEIHAGEFVPEPKAKAPALKRVGSSPTVQGKRRRRLSRQLSRSTTCTCSSSDDAVLAPRGAPPALGSSAPRPPKGSGAPSAPVFLGSFSSSSASESDGPGALGPKPLAGPAEERARRSPRTRRWGSKLQPP